MSNTTKNALAESLKTVLVKKPLDKVTIADITDNCGEGICAQGTVPYV